tara:strand:+ start:982 stop:1134 length:153 start_codon:yes stop_codon:yes gene_type:complete
MTSIQIGPKRPVKTYIKLKKNSLIMLAYLSKIELKKYYLFTDAEIIKNIT